MVYVFLPFLSAALYGLSYVLLEKLLKSVSMLTYMLTSCLCMLVVVGVYALLRPDQLSIAFIHDKKILLMFLASIFIGIAGWVGTLIGLQNTSASYVAFAEISYPLFTLLFLYVLFGEQQFNLQSLLGGALVLMGSVVLVMGRIKT
jgi:drug/metabolite transporter (DMT)-like permease